MFESLGYLLASLMGCVLGLIGGGGSILTVPLLVYAFGIPPLHATSYSLLIVGVTALLGAVRYHFKGDIHYKNALIFGIPSLISVYVTRLYLMPALPETLLTYQGIALTKSLLILCVFGSLMMITACFMIKAHTPALLPQRKHPVKQTLIIAGDGALVGLITGFVGAGGGFLIVPALVMFVRMPMKEAVATSLFIIALKSLAGVLGDLQAHVTFDGTFLICILGFTLGGMVLGTYWAPFVSDRKLKKIFGWLVLILGMAMIGEQITTALTPSLFLFAL